MRNPVAVRSARANPAQRDTVHLGQFEPAGLVHLVAVAVGDGDRCAMCDTHGVAAATYAARPPWEVTS